MQRRARQQQGFGPAAAEVLEVRALLSAATAAVQHAVHSAHAVENAALSPAKAGQPDFQGAVTTVFLVNNQPLLTFPGVISISPVPLQVGAHMSAHVQIVASLQGDNFKFNVAITGKVQFWQPAGVNTRVTLAPGGSISEKLIDSGGHHKSFKTKPSGAPLTILLDPQGHFIGLNMPYAATTKSVAFDFACSV